MGSSEAFGCCGRDGAFEGRTARDGETRPDCEDDGAAVPGVREAYYTCCTSTVSTAGAFRGRVLRLTARWW